MSFRPLKLEIALAFPALNKDRIIANNPAEQGLTILLAASLDTARPSGQALLN